MGSTEVPTSVQAVVLAEVVRLAATRQDSWWQRMLFTALAFAFDERAGDAAERSCTGCVRELALAMLDTTAGVEVDPVDRDLVSAALCPYAVWQRLHGGESGPAVANIVMAAVNRLNVACPGTVSEDRIVEDLVLHESECVADPVVRGPWCLRCPCGAIDAYLCSKCQMVLATVSRTRCVHAEQACTHELDDWVDIDDTCTPV